MTFGLRKLLLVRHGETDWNREGRLQGLTDSALNETGRSQARLLAERLGRSEVDALYTSPLLRAVETAESLAETLRRTPIVLHGLRERDVGTWGGLTYGDVSERHPDDWRRIRAGEDLPVGGGETKARVQRRMLDALEQIGRAHPDGEVVVVSHGFALKTLVCALIALPLEHSERISTGGNASLTTFVGRGGVPRLELLTDCSHLDAAAPSWTGS